MKIFKTEKFKWSLVLPLGAAFAGVIYLTMTFLSLPQGNYPSSNSATLIPGKVESVTAITDSEPEEITVNDESNNSNKNRQPLKLREKIKNTPSSNLTATSSEAFDKKASEKAVSYLAQHPEKFGLTSSHVAIDSDSSLKVQLVHQVRGTAPILVKFIQRVEGLQVFGQEIHVLMNKDFNFVKANGFFASEQVKTKNGTSSAEVYFREFAKAGKINAKATKFSSINAIEIAFRSVGGMKETKLTEVDSNSVYQHFKNKTEFDANSIEPQLLGLQRVKKVIFPQNGALVPAFYAEVQYQSKGTSDLQGYSFVVSANKGEILFTNNLVQSHAYRVNVREGSTMLQDGPLGDVTPRTLTDILDRSDRSQANSQLVEIEYGEISTRDPWLSSGATVTKGNNVHAYADISGGQGFQSHLGDHSAKITSAGIFDYSLSEGAEISDKNNRNAAIVNMFYLINQLHDWFYDAGFNENAGNAQKSNFSRGGLSRDSIHAEGQDTAFYSNPENRKRNNANMMTPADGGNPRMQMYVFDHNNISLTVTIGAETRQLTLGSASYGAQDFDLNSQMIQGIDGSTGTEGNGTLVDGCEPLTNSVAGKIVLIDRGQCSFTQKATNVQAAGALAIVIVNLKGEALSLGGETTEITIPVVSVSKDDGLWLKTAGSIIDHVVLIGEKLEDLDGTFDNGTIVHEWGHYLSNRLVGDGNGLRTSQARSLGEGWGDFLGLLYSVDETDKLKAGNANFEGAYSLAGYTDEDFYFGVRRVPYSTNKAVNSFTFKHIEKNVELPINHRVNASDSSGSNNAEFHNSGEFWALVLWESYVELLNSPRYSFLEAREKMVEYLVGSLMMTRLNPTFIDARDGLLAYVGANSSQDLRLFQRAFAKRGMGQGAKAPRKNDTGYRLSGNEGDPDREDTGEGHRNVVESFALWN